MVFTRMVGKSWLGVPPPFSSSRKFISEVHSSSLPLVGLKVGIRDQVWFWEDAWKRDIPFSVAFASLI